MVYDNIALDKIFNKKIKHKSLGIDEPKMPAKAVTSDKKKRVVLPQENYIFPNVPVEYSKYIVEPLEQELDNYLYKNSTCIKDDLQHVNWTCRRYVEVNSWSDCPRDYRGRLRDLVSSFAERNMFKRSDIYKLIEIKNEMSKTKLGYHSIIDASKSLLIISSKLAQGKDILQTGSCLTGNVTDIQIRDGKTITPVITALWKYYQAVVYMYLMSHNETC
jgi:hypothetical protein